MRSRSRGLCCQVPAIRLGRAKQDASSLKAEMKGVAEEIKGLETELAAVEEALEEILLGVPNIPDASVPVGASLSTMSPLETMKVVIAELSLVASRAGSALRPTAPYPA